jgi:hypothetical protein
VGAVAAGDGRARGRRAADRVRRHARRAAGHGVLRRGRLEVVRAALARPLLGRRHLDRRARRLRDAARGAGRDHATAGAVRALPERLDAPGADRGERAPGPVRPPVRRPVRGG